MGNMILMGNMAKIQPLMKQMRMKIAMPTTDKCAGVHNKKVVCK